MLTVTDLVMEQNFFQITSDNNLSYSESVGMLLKIVCRNGSVNCTVSVCLTTSIKAFEERRHKFSELVYGFKEMYCSLEKRM
jgi:hypothetical protein